LAAPITASKVLKVYNIAQVGKGNFVPKANIEELNALKSHKSPNTELLSSDSDSDEKNKSAEEQQRSDRQSKSAIP
jgi:hypothetical protein